MPTFPVIVTSFEIVIADVKFLAQHQYKYLIVDEGHRLKNYNCRLLRELRTIRTDQKLLLTGGLFGSVGLCNCCAAVPFCVQVKADCRVWGVRSA